jgi:exonuclease III
MMISSTSVNSESGIIRTGHHDDGPNHPKIRPTTLIASFNTCGIQSNNGKIKLDQTANFMDSKNTDVVCIQITHRPDNHTEQINNTTFFFHNPPSAPKCSQYNGGVVIPPSPSALKAWKAAGSSEPLYYDIIDNTTHLMSIDLSMANSKGDKCNLRTFLVYMPCQQILRDASDDFQECMDIAIDNCLRNFTPIIAGDMNTSIETRATQINEDDPTSKRIGKDSHTKSKEVKPF